MNRLILLMIILSLSISLRGQDIKMNQTQVIGSHNSYKVGIEKPLMDLILAENPKATGLDYIHSDYSTIGFGVERFGD